jgi:hypothetical protein
MHWDSRRTGLHYGRDGTKQSANEETALRRLGRAEAAGGSFVKEST